MKKITELYEPFTRITVLPDANGQLQNYAQEEMVRRRVRNTTTGLRFVDYIVDLIGYQLLLTTFGFLFDLLMNLTAGIYPVSRTAAYFDVVFTILLYPAYYIFFEYYWQRTPGKFLTKAVVINEYADKPGLQQIMLRSFIRIVPFEPFSFLGNDNRGWHDKWSDTWVVPVSERETLKKLQQQEEVHH